MLKLFMIGIKIKKKSKKNQAKNHLEICVCLKHKQNEGDVLFVSRAHTGGCEARFLMKNEIEIRWRDF